LRLLVEGCHNRLDRRLSVSHLTRVSQFFFCYLLPADVAEFSIRIAIIMTYDPAIAVIENVRTSRIILRAPTGRDVDTLFRIYGDPRTNAFNPVGPLRSLVDAETTMARWLDHWIEHGFGMWAIALADNPGETIGFGGLTFRPFGAEIKMNLGYRLAVEAWGKGLATELATTAIKVGFQALGLDEVFALVRSSHVASRKVLEKAGLTHSERLTTSRGMHQASFTESRACYRERSRYLCEPPESVGHLAANSGRSTWPHKSPTIRALVVPIGSDL